MLKYQVIEYFLDQKRYVGELIYSGDLDNSRKVILVFPAMEGRGQFVLEYARNLAGQGFVAFVADTYGNSQVFSDLDTIFANLKPLLANRQEIRSRAIAAYEAVSSLNFVDPKKIGAIGFCLGGMSMLELARSGVPLVAGVSVHGVLAKSDLATASPLKTKLLILAGHADPQVPNDNALHGFAEEMESARNTDWIFTFFGGVKHSFSDPSVGCFDTKREAEMGREYNELAANFSFHVAIDFFNQVIKYT